LTVESKIRDIMKKRGDKFFLVWVFLLVAIYITRLVVDELCYASDLTE